MGDWRCALPLARVVEIMRPLPTQPLEGAPLGVVGVSLIRGRTCPVVDLGSLFGSTQPPGRFVLLSFETEGGRSRSVALAVQSVEGVERLSDNLLAELPPLLNGLGEERVEAIAVHDRQLLAVLKGTALLDDSVWEVLETA